MSLAVTEDTPPDMLTGLMDLNVVLPDGKTVKMSVQRGTPMMDLLVLATTTHCLSPGDYSLQPIGDNGILPFKPNTPIGALDTFTVKIVEKKSHNRGRAPQVPQSFLNTFRLQVHLPRSQLFVLRVTPDVSLSEIMNHICAEKNLNLEKYEFRNTAKLDEVLDLNKSLGDYKIQELSLVSKGNRTVAGLMSSADIITVKSSNNRQNSVCESSLSSGSFGSRSGSPVPTIKAVTMPPQPPIRKKRRPAPKPPSLVDKKKKEDVNFGSVLISHSRESSDSSGYHEASVLSESPTHGGPITVLNGGSPPDTLPRRSKLPSSQSFTNLTTIQPHPKGRLVASISNTSLNSTGCSRKKRAPPPPTTTTTTAAPSRNRIQTGNDVKKVKSSTLPTSIAEERRNVSGFAAETDFPNAKADDVSAVESRVQIPVQIVTSHFVNETKASCETKDDVSFAADVKCIKHPPRPKPRTVVPFHPESKKAVATTAITAATTTTTTTRNSLINDSTENFKSVVDLSRNVSSHHQNPTSPDRRESENSSEYRTEAKTGSESSESDLFSGGQRVEFLMCKTKKISPSIRDDGRIGNIHFSYDRSDASEEKISCVDNFDQDEEDSINWEYQLPPPPTDFRDGNSPNCTEYGTITITPEVFENQIENSSKKSDRIDDRTIRLNSMTIESSRTNRKTEIESEDRQNGSVVGKEQSSDQQKQQQQQQQQAKRNQQNKSEVMNELTNILNGNRKQKEKSLSVSNLYIGNDSVLELKKASLNYSRSFSTEPDRFAKMADERGKTMVDNKRLSVTRETEISYKNYKNLEKSCSLECIETVRMDSLGIQVDAKTEDVFRKPVAPVQKKLKMARRSASSLGLNNSSDNSKRINGSAETGSDSLSDDASISLLRQQFLEFLKEKKLMKADFKMKSLDVICDMLPEVANESVAVGENLHRAGGRKTSEGSGDRFGSVENRGKVKVVEVKVKDPVTSEETSNKSKASIRRRGEEEEEEEEEDIQKENVRNRSSGKRGDETKRYSYQGPPSINFGTWGERPKSSRFIIKDEDYVTQEKLTEKKSETVVQTGGECARNGEIAGPKKCPTAETKKPQFLVKKPGVLSHYEMFSALPRKKEISTLKMVFMDDEEKRKMNDSSKESGKVPVVCGVELKKEFKRVEGGFGTKDCPPSSQAVTSQREPIKSKHSVSVYVNGNRTESNGDPAGESNSKIAGGNFIVPRRNPTLMPVVKGFRSLDDNLQTNRVSVVNHSANQIGVSGSSSKEDDIRQKWPTSKTNLPVTPSPPPAPPNINSIKLKPISSGSMKSNPKTVSQDPRSQLMDEIRNFGGLKKLKK